MGAADQTRQDAELAAAARRGDKQAFVEVVARYQAMVCGIALGILGDFAASEDAAQEAFLAAWRRFDDLREPGRLRGWLAEIARNTALGHLRRRRNAQPLDEEMDLADEGPGPDELAARAEELTLVQESLNHLPETYRLPLILYYREGQSVRAVAETLSISEDAVKQRLARGRDMLRDRLLGVVESVLKRTSPTAVFTIAVAAAIGALAAPSAVAGGVFAAASASSSTAATVTTSTNSILTVMTTSKGFILSAALVAAVISVPLGYRIGAGQPAPPARSARAAARKERTAGARPHIADNPLFAEWRHLHEVYGTDGPAMPLIFNAISRLKDPFQRRAFTAALISEWVQVDPAGGFAFFGAKGHDQSQRRQFFQEWLAADPQAAINAFLAAGKPWQGVVRDSLADIARDAPSRLAEVVEALPKPDDDNYWDTKVRDAFAVLAEADLTQARTVAEGLKGPNREQALEGVARVWGKSDPNGVINWARKLPGNVDHDELIRCALVGLASVNAADALDEIGLVPSGGREGYFATETGARVLKAAVQSDFQGTVAWIAAHPGQLTREDLMGMVQAVTERLNADPADFLKARAADGSLAGVEPAIGNALLNGAASQRLAVWDWLKTQPDNSVSRQLRQDVLNGGAFQDPSLALRLAPDLPNTAEGNSEIQSLAADLLNGGSMLYRLDSLLSQAPERLRQPLVESAFRDLQGNNLGDPQTWVSRLSQVPPTDRASAEQSLAHAWAEQSPEAAAAWAQSMSPGSQRGAVMADVTSSWAGTDPAGAGAWVAAMSPGTERDRSAQAMAMALSNTDPRTAWDWALSISDPAQRELAATPVVKAMAARDLGTARQWIQDSSLTADAKARLEGALNAMAQRAGQ